MLTAGRRARRSRPHRVTTRRRRRAYVGSEVTPRESARVFLSRTTQQMASRTALADWIGGVFLACGIVGWGALIVFLGS